MIKKANLIIYLCIACITFLIGCKRTSSHSSVTPFVTVWHGNLKDGGIVLYLPLSVGYQHSKKGNRTRYIWKDDKGNSYAFVVVIVKSDSTTIIEEAHNEAIKSIKVGRSRGGWRLVEEGSYQTFSSYHGKRMLFQREDRLAEWIYFPFESYPGGVVIYWYSTRQRYHIDRKVIDAFLKRAELIHPIVPKVKEERKGVS